MTSIPAETVLVPLASEDDARETCRALVEHLDGESRLVLVYVSEKGGGAVDKTSPEQDQSHAESLFTIARAILETEGLTVDTRICYGTDVADTIHQTAVDEDADLVVFSPREASRLARFLSGDVALDLITDPDVPVLVLPASDTSGEA